MQKNIILICGAMGSGKDTLADFLCYYIADSRRIAFAAPLKEMAPVMFDFPPEWCSTHEGKNKYIPAAGMTVGEILQQLGTDAVHPVFGKDVWCRIAKAKIDASHNKTFIISDCRTLAEADFFMNHMRYNTRILWIEREGSKETKRDPNHPSEQGRFDILSKYMGNRKLLLIPNSSWDKERTLNHVLRAEEIKHLVTRETL